MYDFICEHCLGTVRERRVGDVIERQHDSRGDMSVPRQQDELPGEQKFGRR